MFQQDCIDGYRAIQSVQDKAWVAGYGRLWHGATTLGKSHNVVLDALGCSLRASTATPDQFLLMIKYFPTNIRIVSLVSNYLKPDNKADNKKVNLNAYMSTTLLDFTPFIPSDKTLEQSTLPDKALELNKESAKLTGQLASQTLATLEQYMRVINSYYSNLIEGNATRPHEIRAAQRGDYSGDPANPDYS